MAENPFDKYAPGEQPTYTDLVEAVRQLMEGKQSLTVSDLPLAALKNNLEQTWQPSTSMLLQPASVGVDLLAPLPHVAVSRAALQAVAHGVFSTATDIVWDSAIDRNDTMWVSGADVLLPRAGLWLITTAVQYQPAAAAARLASIFANGVEQSRTQFASAGASDFAEAHVSVCRRFTAGTLIRTRAYQDSGASVNVLANLDCTWVGS